jgi:hypothetical protein
MKTKFFLVFLFFLAVAGFKTWPLLTHLDTHIASDPLDPLLCAWILAWDVHALTTDPMHLFDANIFYPVKRSLAFSEHLLGVLPIFAPVFLLTGNPILGYNLVFFLSFVLSGVAMFALSFYWTRELWPSLVAGTLFAFAPIRFAQISRLHLLNLFWAPVALIFLDRFLRGRGWWDLVGFAVCYWLQVLASVYLGYMTTLMVVVYVGYYALFVDRTLLQVRLIPKALTFLGGSLLILMPVYLPYLAVSREWDISRTFDSIISTDIYAYSSAEPLNYLSVPALMADFYRTVFAAADAVAGSNEKWLFPGIVLPALVILGCVSRGAGVVSRRIRAWRRICGLVLALAFLLSLGPFLIVLGHKTDMPLPYLFFFHALPGFRALRSPSRFALLGVLAAIPLASLGAVRLSEAFAKLTRATPLARFAPALMALLLIALALLELGLKPLPLAKISTGQDIPAVYRWLAAERPGPIIELPFGLFQDYSYVYYSTKHWLPLINGASGLTPWTYLEMKEALQTLPSSRAVEYLKALGVRAVVVHTDRLRPDELTRWQAKQVEAAGLQEVQAFGADILYGVPAATHPAHLRLQLAIPDWLPAGAQARLGLALEAISGAMSRHPQLHDRSAHQFSIVRIEWKTPGAAPILTSTQVPLPLVMLPGEPAIAPIRLETPRTPGIYTLRLSIPSLNATADAGVVEIREAWYPTSLTEPRMLSASYSADVAEIPMRVEGHETIRLTLTVQNTGQAVWLAEAPGDRGAVTLGWRWFEGDQALPGMEGRMPLRYDVFPGQSHAFTAATKPPDAAGTYRLQLDLVSEHLAWFANLGIPPVHLNVQVHPSTACESFDRLLTQWSGPAAHAPRFRLSTDRRQYRPAEGHVHVLLKLDHVEQPGRVDTYLALRRPGCYLSFLEWGGHLPLTNQTGPWPSFIRSLPLVKGSDAPLARIYAFPVASLFPGSYEMTLVLTEPNSYQIIAHANTTFHVEQ